METEVEVEVKTVSQNRIPDDQEIGYIASYSRRLYNEDNSGNDAIGKNIADYLICLSVAYTQFNYYKPQYITTEKNQSNAGIISMVTSVKNALRSEITEILSLPSANAKQPFVKFTAPIGGHQRSFTKTVSRTMMGTFYRAINPDNVVDTIGRTDIFYNNSQPDNDYLKHYINTLIQLIHLYPIDNLHYKPLKTLTSNIFPLINSYKRILKSFAESNAGRVKLISGDTNDQLKESLAENTVLQKKIKTLLLQIQKITPTPLDTSSVVEAGTADTAGEQQPTASTATQQQPTASTATQQQHPVHIDQGGRGRRNYKRSSRKRKSKKSSKRRSRKNCPDEDEEQTKPRRRSRRGSRKGSRKSSKRKGSRKSSRRKSSKRKVSRRKGSRKVSKRKAGSRRRSKK